MESQFLSPVGVLPHLRSEGIYRVHTSVYYLQNSNNSTCFFKPTNEEEIVKIIRKLGSRKSPGCDGIKSDLVKQVAAEISLPLKIIFNVSLQTGIVPDDLKVAKVVPIYKKDNPEIGRSVCRYSPVMTDSSRLQQHHTTSDEPGQGCKAHEGGHPTIDLIWSIHLVLGLPGFLLPSTQPCIMTFSKEFPPRLAMCPKYFIIWLWT